MMKKNLLILMFALLLSSMGYAQLTGTYAIPGTLPTGYPTFAAAISDLNTQGVGLGGVTFNIAAGYSETLSSTTAGTITTATGSASNPILFQKSGAGTNPAITAAVATSAATDGIIVLAGTDYVTFDGIDVKENPVNTANKTEWGYAILMASATNASQNIKIKNCTITLDKTNTSSRGIYSSNHSATSTTAIIPTDPAGVVNNCDVDNCTISNVYYGINFVGYNASAPYSLYGQMNHFGMTTGNTITNFGGGSPAAHGIFTSYQNDIVVANNTINGGVGSTGLLGGVYVNTANNANADIYSNIVSLTSSATGPSAIYAIYNAGSTIGTTNTVNIYGNTVENCSLSAATNGNWYMINNMAKTLTTNIHDNVVRNNSKPEVGGTVYMFYLSGSTTVTENVYNNQVYGNSVTAGGTSVFYGLYCNTSASNKNIYGNQIYGNTVTSSSMYGIYTSGGTDVAIYQNSIYGQNASSSGPILNYGVRINGGTNINLYNNQITDLTAPASTSAFALRGISVDNGTNIGLYYNTIFLNGSSTGTNFGSTCVYASTTPNLEMRNNILVSTSVPNGTGNSTAFWRTTTNINTYASTSNNNCFYAGTPGPQNLIFYDGTTAFQNLSDYKVLTSPADANSFTEMPPFINPVTTPYNLHLSTTVPTQCESGGSIVSTPVNITTDFDNVARYPNTGYPNNVAHPATAPDAGAFEFAGISVDLSPPGILFTPFLNTSLTTLRTLSASITDPSGVPVSGAGLPVCYWKVNAGPYTAVQGIQGTGSNYIFMFGNGTALGDVVSYYIVAQDMVSPPNVGSNPSAGAGGYTANPPACSTPPTSPYTYTIIPSISGNVTVGTGGTYPSLTGSGGLFEDINSKALAGNLTATIISDLTEDGTNALAKCIEDGIGNYTISIRPDGATERLIEGNVAFPMIRFYGAQRATIDGRYNGSGKYLRFRNTNTSNADFEFWNDANNDTLRDCIWESGNTITAAAQAGVIRFSITNGANGNDNNVVMNNVIRDFTNGTGQPSRGIFANGSASAYNSYNTIIGNEVLNFRDYGIYISANNDHITVSDNSLYNNLSIPPTTSINCIYFVSASGGDGNVISGNYIGGSAPMCGGTPWLMNTTGGLTGIYLSVGSVEPTEVYNNTYSNIQSILTTGAGAYYGIYGTSTGAFHIGTLGGNVIGSLTSANSIVFDGTNTFRGIYNINQTDGNTVDNNVVANITWSRATGTASSIYGIVNYKASVRNNRIFNIGSQQADFIPTIYGLYDNGSAGGTNEYSNNIVDLDGGAATNPVLYAFTENAPATGGANLYFNTFYIHGPATTTSSTNVLRRTLGSSMIMKNNIFFNGRVSGGTGSHYAVWDNVTASMISDYNDIYSVAGPLGYTGGSDVTTLPAWQSATAGDTHSESVDPNFVSASDFHPTNTLLNGLGIAIPGITTDYNGNTRTTPPDAGAFEWSVNITDYHTLPATFISETGAQLNGDLNSRGEMVEAYFEWGLTTAYGNTANVSGYGTPPLVRTNTLTPLSSTLSGLAPYTTYHYRLHGVPVTSGQMPFDGEDMTFTTLAFPSTVITLLASDLVGSNATLNGSVNANFTATDVTFEWGLTTAYGNTVTASPAVVSGSTPVAVSAPVSGLATGTIYHYRCVGNSPGGIVYGNDVTFTSDCPAPLQPGTITGPPSVCKNSTGITYSVAPVSGATGYNWTVPTGATITSGGNTNSITVDFSVSSINGNITVNGINNCGPGLTSSLAVVVNNIPVPTISGPAAMCQGITNNVYTTEAGMTSYNWNVTGGTITFGAGTNSITVTWETAGAQTVTVNYANSNGCFATNPGSFNVQVDAIPVPTITGDNVACESSAYLDYTTEPGMTNYVWDMTPNSGTITQTGTNVVTIFWTAPGAKWVSVSYTNANGCAAAAPTVYNVTVNPLPGTPGTISGSSSVCAGSTGVAYSVAAVSNATTYVWSLPAGATIATGSGTNSITVNFSQSAVAGDISVLAQNTCGNGMSSPALAVIVNSAAGAAGTITGTTSICQGTSGITYTVAPITGATTYNWTVPAGATIASGANTNTITVDFGTSAVSGNITVTGSNTCGAGTPSSLAVTVNTKPVTPVITQNLNILSSDAASGNQWYRDGVLIPGATGQTYEVTENGTYTVVVTLSGCSSDPSNEILMLNVGISEPDASVVSVYPNPSTGEFWLTINSKGSTLYEMNLVTNSGAVVYRNNKLEVNGSFKKQFNFSDLPAGMYTLILRSDSNLITKKIIINK